MWLDRCPAASVTMEASEGTFVDGKVSPAIKGLSVRIEANNELITTVLTNAEGKYRWVMMILATPIGMEIFEGITILFGYFTVNYIFNKFIL